MITSSTITRLTATTTTTDTFVLVIVTNVMSIIVGSTTIVTNTVMLEGDFEQVVGTKKSKFLKEYTNLLSSNMVPST